MRLKRSTIFARCRGLTYQSRAVLTICAYDRERMGKKGNVASPIFFEGSYSAVWLVRPGYEREPTYGLVAFSMPMVLFGALP